MLQDSASAYLRKGEDGELVDDDDDGASSVKEGEVSLVGTSSSLEGMEMMVPSFEEGTVEMAVSPLEVASEAAAADASSS